MKTTVIMLLGLAVLCVAVPTTFAEVQGEGQDIVDLLTQKKIEAKTHGAGIEDVSLELRRLVKQDLTVRIPVGTFFVSRRTSAQNMVSTEAATVGLQQDGWVSVSIPAACANRPRDIPGNEDNFTIRRAPQQKELQKLMPIVSKASVSSAVRQAAVWIVTDNADYEDMGILVASFGPVAFGGSRVIDEEAVTRAMQLCDEAGINITAKAIWRDRNTILKGLKDEPLRKWLRARARR